MRYDEKFKIKVAMAYSETGNAADVATQFEVPVWSVYRWGKLYGQGGAEGLKEKSRKPKSQPLKTDDKIERLVVATWFNTVTNRNYSSVSRALSKQGIKVSSVTVNAIVNRREDLWPK